jgi:hypothetical protein
LIFVIAAVLWTEGVGGRYRRCRRSSKSKTLALLVCQSEIQHLRALAENLPMPWRTG